MSNQSQNNEKNKYILMGVSIVITIFGLMFLLTAAELVIIFKGLTNIENVLGRYIIVILTMASGIMLFSNVAIALEDEKLRNRLTIGVTTFSTILTLPLVYVFIAIFWAENGIIGPIGEIMMIGDISNGFNQWFGTGAFIYVLYAFMFVVSIVFIAFPLITGGLAIKGKALKIGKQDSGKFGIGTMELPIITKINSRDNK